MKAQLGLISPKYVFDANVFGDFWDTADPYRSYPIDIRSHRQTWEFIEGLMSAGSIISSIEVKEQLMNSDLSELKKWIKEYGYVFLEMDAAPRLQQHLQAIHVAFPAYENRKADVVDAVVIGTAMSLACAVVSSERRVPNPGVLPKIPNVCDNLGVQCLNINEFLRLENYN